MSDKGPDAFRTISEVADELDLPQHVLRFWETKFSQIRPLKRSSGRRFYRPEDVALLRNIREMLYGQGYTIRGVQKLLKERGRPAATDAVVDSVVATANISALTDVAEPLAISQGVFDLEQRRELPPLDADLADALRALVVDLRECAAVLSEARRV